MTDERTRIADLTKQIEKEFTDQGLLIEAGWAGFRIAVLKDAPQIQIDEMRTAFFAGAQHLFSSIMNILEPGEEPTEVDLKRLDLIDKELRKFGEEFMKKLQTKGEA